jgi:MoxR-like ATPase
MKNHTAEKINEKILLLEFPSIYGQDQAKKQLKSALLTHRHIILVGPPGVGKTTIAKEVAKLFGNKEESFVRVQGSPDLTAEDLIGDIDPIKAITYGPLSKEAFVQGKIFKAHKGVLFFDEVNRCSEKLQNALLQALEERKVTIGSYDVDFDADFVFIGTMNPQDTSTEPLSDVFLDRFDLITMSYPESLELEKQIVKEKGLSLVVFPETLLTHYIEFIRTLRNDERLEKKPSVRASLGIYERAQSNAILEKRKQVTLKDIQDVLVSVLSHRITLKPSIKYLTKPEDFVEQAFNKKTEKLGDVP